MNVAPRFTILLVSNMSKFVGWVFKSTLLDSWSNIERFVLTFFLWLCRPLIRPLQWIRPFFNKVVLEGNLTPFLLSKLHRKNQKGKKERLTRAKVPLLHPGPQPSGRISELLFRRLPEVREIPIKSKDISPKSKQNHQREVNYAERIFSRE